MKVQFWFAMSEKQLDWAFDTCAAISSPLFIIIRGLWPFAMEQIQIRPLHTFTIHIHGPPFSPTFISQIEKWLSSVSGRGAINHFVFDLSSIIFESTDSPISSHLVLMVVIGMNWKAIIDVAVLLRYYCDLTNTTTHNLFLPPWQEASMT